MAASIRPRFLNYALQGTLFTYFDEMIRGALPETGQLCHIYWNRNTLFFLGFLHHCLGWLYAQASEMYHYVRRTKPTIRFVHSGVCSATPATDVTSPERLSRTARAVTTYLKKLYIGLRLKSATLPAPTQLIHQIMETVATSPLTTIFYDDIHLPPQAVLDQVGLTKEFCRRTNTRMLFHTPGCEPEVVVASGMSTRFSKVGSFGRGCYFTDNMYKAMTYFRPEWGVKRDKHHPDCNSVLVCLVALGRIKQYPRGECQTNLNKEPPGFDSVQGNVRDNNNEYVVYEDNRILISFVLYYKGNAPPPPPPINPNAANGNIVVPSTLKHFLKLQVINRADKIDPETSMQARLLICKLLKENPHTDATLDLFMAFLHEGLKATAHPGLRENIKQQLKLVNIIDPQKVPDIDHFIANSTTPFIPKHITHSPTIDAKPKRARMEDSLAPQPQLPPPQQVPPPPQQLQPPPPPQQVSPQTVPVGAVVTTALQVHQKSVVQLPKVLIVFLNKLKELASLKNLVIEQDIFLLIHRHVSPLDFVNTISQKIQLPYDPSVVENLKAHLQHCVIVSHQNAS